MKQYFVIPVFLFFLGLLGINTSSPPGLSSPPSVSVSPVAETQPHITVVITTPQSTTTTFVLTEEQIAGLHQLQVEKDRETWGKCGEWHDLSIAVGWSEKQWKYLQQVIHRESRCQADAWNGHDAGLLQVNQIHSDFINQMGMGQHPEAMFVAENNLRFALKLWEGSGKDCWKHWRFSGTTFGCEK